MRTKRESHFSAVWSNGDLKSATRRRRLWIGCNWNSHRRGDRRKEAKTSLRIALAGTGNDADDVLTPKAAENPVVAALKARGLYKTPLGSGKHDITCPWACMSIPTGWTPARPILNPTSFILWVDFAASIRTVTNTTSGSCSNSLVSPTPRRGTNR